MCVCHMLNKVLTYLLTYKNYGQAYGYCSMNVHVRNVEQRATVSQKYLVFTCNGKAFFDYTG